MSSSFALDPWLAARRAEIDGLLDARLPARPRADDPGQLVEAMRYSLLAPGKRLRPMLALAAAEAVSGGLSDATRIAASAVELVHCYSLIHDDLPCMDDDDVRRGRPTSHKVFGEAIATLAGDALLTLAFEWLAEMDTAPDHKALAISALARAAGMAGMVRGQARDLAEPPPGTWQDAERLYREKTGALFRAAVEVGAAVAGGSRSQLDALARFGESFGVAFQYADDLADHEHLVPAGKARERNAALAALAIEALAGFDHRARPLRELANRLAAS